MSGVGQINQDDGVSMWKKLADDSWINSGQKTKQTARLSVADGRRLARRDQILRTIAILEQRSGTTENIAMNEEIIVTKGKIREYIMQAVQDSILECNELKEVFQDLDIPVELSSEIRSFLVASKKGLKCNEGSGGGRNKIKSKKSKKSKKTKKTKRSIRNKKSTSKKSMKKSK